MLAFLTEYWWIWNVAALLLAIFFWWKRVDHVIEAGLIVFGIALIGIAFKFLALPVIWVIMVVVGAGLVCKPDRASETMNEEAAWALVGLCIAFLGLTVRYYALIG